MATLNLSTNGPSIQKSYQAIVNAPAPSGPSASSPTYGQWAVFSVQAPLVSAFQNSSTQESVLKVQTTGEGELADLIDEFSDGRIQFAFVRVKDPNTGLPKNVLIAWCGEGVPERTKGYFGSHLTAAQKLLHGYHVQVTSRSEGDLTPEGIVQKVADASGSKYGGGAATSDSSSAPKPAPPTSKPVFMPTRTGGSGFGTLGSRLRVGAGQSGGTDQDGWGEDAPQVTRSQLEKVESAYKPTKVNMAELTGQKQEPSRFQPQQREDTNGSGDVVRGGYQPIGKVDIAAIRRQAQESGQVKDDRPTTVKGSYEPVGKVDIAAIRAKAQQAPSPVPQTATGGSQRSEEQEDERPKSLADRSAAFTQSERLTSMPKPKVANRFGSNTSSFAGTKAPTPVAPSKPIDKAAPVGIASRTFADEGGKTPAQIWAEKKARERGNSGAASNPPSAGFNKPTSPIQSQPSGGWSSGYTGKSWAPVQTTRTGTSNVSAQRTGEPEHEEEDVLQQPTGSIGSIRDRFKDAPPMGASNIGRSAPQDEDESFAPPPPLDTSSKPNAGVRGVPMPGLPTRLSQPEPEPEQVPEDVPEEEHFSVPPPPAVPRSPTPPTPQEPSSPIRVAMPVSRNAEPEPMEAPEEHFSPPPMPSESLAKAVSNTAAAPEDEEDDHDDAARGVAETAAASTFGAGAETAHPGAGVAGKTALIQYDYEKAEDNEIELREGEYVTNIEMVDEDWWMGQNSKGETGLFPSNYVELVEDGASGAGAGAPEAPEAAAQEEPDFHQHAAPPAAEAGGKTATAQYDYEAAEDNELSFPDGAVITGVEFPDEDWWFGHFNGKEGLFPANYVELNN